jgi:ATP phosphoribosyltransferase regulatory subunit HisZ
MSDWGPGFSDAQRSGFDVHQADQDRTLKAMHALERALSEAAPGREPEWRAAVLQALVVLDSATAEEATNAERPDSLLSDLAHNQPRLRNRTRALRVQYAKLRDTISSLRHEIEDHLDAGTDFVDLRQRLGWALAALRYQRARESDLIYEAYYDAFKEELRATRPPGDGGEA